MHPYNYYVGIDISNLDFCASIYSTPQAQIETITELENAVPGFEKFETWLHDHQVTASNCVICLEATGVYAETFSYYFTAKGYKVAVEPPLKVKRSFPNKRHKTDKVDSKEIAEYAYRFCDELRIWRPKEQMIEQIQVLLMTREQLVGQRTACKNTRNALKKKKVQTPLANRIYDQNITRFNKQIRNIEKELKNLIDKHPDFKKTVQKLKSIPGVALLMASNFLVITNGFENELAKNHRKAAAFISICPYQHESGTSVKKKPKIVKYGPARLRKLLHLAARSVVKHNPTFKKYYELKKAQGKPRKLILNNVGNKILKIMCALIQSQRTYVDSYVSIHPKIALINS
jgi:transposase